MSFEEDLARMSKNRDGRKDLLLLGFGNNQGTAMSFYIMIQAYKNHSRKKGAMLIDNLFLWKARGHKFSIYSQFSGANDVYIEPLILTGWENYKTEFEREVTQANLTAQSRGTFMRKITALKRRPPHNLFDRILQGVIDTAFLGIKSSVEMMGMEEVIRFGLETLEVFKHGMGGGNISGMNREEAGYKRIMRQISSIIEVLNRTQDVFSADQLGLTDAISVIK